MEENSCVFTNDPNEQYVNGQYNGGDSSSSSTSSFSNHGTPTHTYKRNLQTPLDTTTKISQANHQLITDKQMTNPFLNLPNEHHDLLPSGGGSNNYFTFTPSQKQEDSSNNIDTAAVDNINSTDNKCPVTSNTDSIAVSSYFAHSTKSLDTKCNSSSDIVGNSRSIPSVTSLKAPSSNPFINANKAELNANHNSNNVVNNHTTIDNSGSTHFTQFSNNTATTQSYDDETNVSYKSFVSNNHQTDISRFNNSSQGDGSDIQQNIASFPSSSNSSGYVTQSTPFQFQNSNASPTGDFATIATSIPSTLKQSYTTTDVVTGKYIATSSVNQQNLTNFFHNYPTPSASVSFPTSSSSTVVKAAPVPSENEPVGVPEYPATTLPQQTTNLSAGGINPLFQSQNYPSMLPPQPPMRTTVPPPQQYNASQNRVGNYPTAQNYKPAVAAPTQQYFNSAPSNQNYANKSASNAYQFQNANIVNSGANNSTASVNNYPPPMTQPSNQSATNPTMQYKHRNTSQVQQHNFPNTSTRVNQNYPVAAATQKQAPTSFSPYTQQQKNQYPQQRQNQYQQSQQSQYQQLPHLQHQPQQQQQYQPQQQQQYQPQQQQQYQQQQQQQYLNSSYYQNSNQSSYNSRGSDVNALSGNLAGMSVSHGYNKLRGMECVDLLSFRDILPSDGVSPPLSYLSSEYPEEFRCDPDILRCTLNKIPESRSLLDKSRLPLGILLHPFRDLKQLTIINCTTIVRCRSCRTYINPFVYFIDSRHWKCNLCFRTNDVPDDFLYNPTSKMYDDPTLRPEVRTATIEFIAPSEYMVRPPQAAVYLFVLDVSQIATQSGYLSVVCDMILTNLDKLPGDSRMSVGFITFDSTVHYYSISEGHTRPRQLIIPDINDVFLPLPEDLIVNLNENKKMVEDLLRQLPEKYANSFDSNSALGPALQAAYKLMAPTGGRVTVFQTCLPNHGPGALKCREDPQQRTTDQTANLKLATDFYKKLGLECNSQHVAVDLFILNSQYLDLLTIAGICQVSGGCMYHFPLFNIKNPAMVDKFEKVFTRYLTRKIGFEAVMRLRCTRGLSIHSFHGNFFVRTTDLLALPNINPDAGFGMQVAIDESLSGLQNVTFQAALLYTSSKGERRIRVHTLCLPVSSNLQEIVTSADQQCIVGLLAKMAVDRTLQSSLSDAREAFINAIVDSLNVYKTLVAASSHGPLLAPANMQLFPLYLLAVMKHTAFRIGEVRIDDRVHAMHQMKCLPLDQLIRLVYPNLYAVHNIVERPRLEEEPSVPYIPLLQLSAERTESSGIYLMDDGDFLTILVGQNVSSQMCLAFFGISQYSSIQENNVLPKVSTPENSLLQEFINYLQLQKPYCIPVQIIKYTSPARAKFFEKLIEDKTESGVSYYEFLQTVRAKMS